MIAMRFGRRQSAPASRSLIHRDRARPCALRVEPLESRTLLSALSLLEDVVAQPMSFTPLAGAAGSTPRGFSPSLISRAYGFDQISFQGGAVKADGSGQTIAIVAAYDNPNIESDLRVFNQTFGLPEIPNFRKINQNGGTSMPAVDAVWAQEIALDVQWAHAMAPGASIVLVEANTASLSDLLVAVDTARRLPDVTVVSMSWGAGEFASQGEYSHYFTTPQGHAPVTFVAAAGDSGAQAVWPAISPNVIAVGGTALSASASGYRNETAWSSGGGGLSRYEARPSYQSSVQTGATRTSPDVSYVANPNTGVAIYDSVGLRGRSGWFMIGGTSAGAPQWAALVAIVDQGRTLSGQPLLGDGHAELYSLASSDFYDVRVGSNGFRALAGYDLVTGRGSPVAQAIVRDLVGTSAIAAPVALPPAPTPAPVPAPAPSPTRYELVYRDRRWYHVPVAANASVAAGGDPRGGAPTPTAPGTTVAGASNRSSSSPSSAVQQSAGAARIEVGGIAVGLASAAARADGKIPLTGVAIGREGASARHEASTQTARQAVAGRDSQPQQVIEAAVGVALADLDVAWEPLDGLAAVGEPRNVAALREDTPAIETRPAVATRKADAAVSIDECLADEGWLADAAALGEVLFAHGGLDLAMLAAGLALATRPTERGDFDRQFVIAVSRTSQAMTAG